MNTTKQNNSIKKWAFRVLVAIPLLISDISFGYNPPSAPQTATNFFAAAPTLSISSGNLTYPLTAGAVFKVTLTSSISGITVQGCQPSGVVSSWMVEFIQGSGSYTLSHPTGINWLGAGAPTMPTTPGSIMDLTYVSIDGCSTVHGFVNNPQTTIPLGSVTGLGTGVATALSTNVGTAGAPVVLNGAGGTPSSLVGTNETGLPISTGVSGLGTGVATALSTNIGTAGAPVVLNSAGGTPSSIGLAYGTGLPIGGISATGTPSGTTYLRGDGTWATVSSGGASVSSANTWTALQTYNNSDWAMLGSSTGYTTFSSANAGSSNYTLTLPAGTSTVLASVNAPSSNPVTGTPTGSNFLRGDGTWAVPSGTGAGILGPYSTVAALQTAYAAASNIGQVAYVGSAAPYIEYYSNGISWTPIASRVTMQSAIPMVIAPAGTVTASTGVFTATNAFQTQSYPQGAYFYFASGGLSSGPSPAGWYWTVCSTTTSCIVYTSTYNPATDVPPTVGSTATPYSTTAVSYAGLPATTYIVAEEVAVPGNTLGISGTAAWNILSRYFGSANTKTSRAYFGSTPVSGFIMSGNTSIGINTPSSGSTIGSTGTLQNRGVTGYQISTQASIGPSYLSYDTTATTYIQFVLEITTQGEWVDFEQISVTVQGGN